MRCWLGWGPFLLWKRRNSKSTPSKKPAARRSPFISKFAMTWRPRIRTAGEKSAWARGAPTGRDRSRDRGKRRAGNSARRPSASPTRRFSSTSRPRRSATLILIKTSSSAVSTIGARFSTAPARSTYTTIRAWPQAILITMALTISTSASPRACPTGSIAIAATAHSKTLRNKPEWMSSTIQRVRFSQTLRTKVSRICLSSAAPDRCSS